MLLLLPLSVAAPFPRHHYLCPIALSLLLRLLLLRVSLIRSRLPREIFIDQKGIQHFIHMEAEEDDS